MHVGSFCREEHWIADASMHGAYVLLFKERWVIYCLGMKTVVSDTPRAYLPSPS